jgi:hypothetical protein
MKQLLEEANDTRLKIYFNLTELMDITGLSIRALKYRMLMVKRKYEDVPTLLSKENKQWKIHYSIIREFEPKYNLKTKTVYTYNWASMATWNTKFNYDCKYHVEIVAQIKKQLPVNVLSYTIETDSRGFNHTHIISDAETHILNNAVTSTMKRFIENPKEYKILVEPIYNKYSAVKYIKKAPLLSGVLK